MKRRQLLLAVSSLAVLALLAGLLWGWPGYLRGRTDPATGPAATATRLAEGLARGDASTLALLAPADGSDRQLLTPEAARATYGESPRIHLEPSSQGRAAQSFRVTIAGDHGTTSFTLQLDQLAGEFGEWTPRPLALPLIDIRDQRPDGVDDPVSINGTRVKPGGAASLLALPLTPSVVTAASPDGAPLITAVNPTRPSLGIQDVRQSVTYLVLSSEAGEGYASAAKAATLRFLEGCAAQGADQEVLCPLAPPARERGVTDRRAVSYADILLSSGVQQPGGGPQRLKFSAAVTWEERSGDGAWRKASGSTTGSMYASFVRDGNELRLVPGPQGGWGNVGDRLRAETPPELRAGVNAAGTAAPHRQ